MGMYEEMRRAVELAELDQRQMLLRDLIKETDDIRSIINRAVKHNNRCTKLLNLSTICAYAVLVWVGVLLAGLVLDYTVPSFPIYTLVAAQFVILSVGVFSTWRAGKLLNEADRRTDELHARIPPGMLDVEGDPEA